MKTSTFSFPLITRFALGVLLIVVLSLAIFTMVMAPPLPELGLMALFLAITALVSSLAGYGAYRLGWTNRSPTLRWSLLGGYALSSLLTFFNVWFSAQLMFASQHDLLLAIVLLLFAGGMAMALGYFLSTTITDRIYLLKGAAERLAKGNLKTRVAVQGRDEVATLAYSFNQMAEQLEAMEDGVVEDPETIKRYLNTAQRDVRSLSALIDDLFQMAQLNTGGIPLDRAQSSLADLISDTLESFSELAARQDIKLEGNVDANVDPVYMDTQRIGRVLNNLISNALRHTPAGGEVKVYAGRTGSGVEVIVSDTGEGIREEDLPHVFESFYRGEKSRSRATGGAGLGLAISRGIVQAHGGEIKVQSEPGQGSQFTFSIP